MKGPNFNDPLIPPTARPLSPADWGRQAPRRGAGPDPHGLPAKSTHIRFNLWEIEQLQRLCLKEGLTLQQLVRNTMRRRLFEEAESVR